MLRCEHSAGYFRLTLQVLHDPDLSYTVGVMGHHDIYAEMPDGRHILAEAAPIVSPAKPYEGELCVHEIDWLQGVPGHAYPFKYVFTLERLEGK